MKLFAGTDDMGELFAGSLTGYAMALVFTGAAARLVVAARSRFTFLSRAIAPNLGTVMLAVPISILSFLIWTLVGILLGLIYRAAVQADSLGGVGESKLAIHAGCSDGWTALSRCSRLRLAGECAGR